MQQLISAFGIDWHLLIAQAVNFGIVLVALWYFLYKPVIEVLEKRKAAIARGVADAERAAQMLAGADQEVAQRVKAAGDEAERIVAAARLAAHDEKEHLVAEAEARATAITTDAEMRSKEIAARAERESEKEVARLAILAAEKILKKQYD